MPLIGRPKVPKSLPKSYPAQTVAELVAAIDADHGSTRRNDWPERDLAIVFTALLGGLRADELISANIGDIRRTDDGGVLHVHGTGNKDRRIPFGRELLDVLEQYLQSRAVRLPQARRRPPGADALSSFSPRAPLFVGADGEQDYPRHAAVSDPACLQEGRYQQRTGFRRPRPRAAAHLRRRTGQRDVSVYTLMKLLGHESMTTSQRYVSGAGTENRCAAAQNPLYELIQQPISKSPT